MYRNCIICIFLICQKTVERILTWHIDWTKRILKIKGAEVSFETLIDFVSPVGGNMDCKHFSIIRLDW